MIKRVCIVSLAVLACVACSERDTTSNGGSAPTAGEALDPHASGADDGTSHAAAARDKAALEEAAAYSAQLHEQSVRAVEEEALVAAIQAQVEQQDLGNPPPPAPASSAKASAPLTEEEALIAAIQAQVEQQQASEKKVPPPAD